ncbi:MAG: restriction endonuclease subunit S [Eubacterium sp.]|nr:restriction endonuclease subunit S [Eubacterium sp.]
MSLNNCKWGEFLLGDEKYFSIHRGESSYIKNMISGDIPYISTTKENNGVLTYVDVANRKGNLISLAYDGSIGACFYQSKPFFASEKIVTIDTVQYPLNKNLAFFLIQILKIEAEMYSYGGRKWTVEKQLKNTKIKLPVDSNNEPDYKYMESYIENLNSSVKGIPDYFLQDGYEKSCWYLDNIDQNKFEYQYAGCQYSKKLKLSDRKWKLFSLEQDLNAKVYNGKSYNSSDLVEAIDESYVLYITRTDENNGIAKYVQALDYVGLEKANAITIGDTTSTIFYQNHKFITGPHIIIVRADWLSVYTAEFIISLLNKEKYRYPVFGRAFTKDLIKQTKLYLPIDDNEQPDFQFMEDYIKSLPFSAKL